MDKQEEGESCAHDWRITDTQMSGTMQLFFVICRRCGARGEARSYAELQKMGATKAASVGPR